MTKKFSMVLEQWADHPQEKWRSRWISEAKLWKDKIPVAKMVLALANGEVG